MCILLTYLLLQLSRRVAYAFNCLGFAFVVRQFWLYLKDTLCRLCLFGSSCCSCVCMCAYVCGSLLFFPSLVVFCPCSFVGPLCLFVCLCVVVFVCCCVCVSFVGPLCVCVSAPFQSDEGALLFTEAFKGAADKRRTMTKGKIAPYNGLVGLV